MLEAISLFLRICFLRRNALFYREYTILVFTNHLKLSLDNLTFLNNLMWQRPSNDLQLTKKHLASTL